MSIIPKEKSRLLKVILYLATFFSCNLSLIILNACQPTYQDRIKTVTSIKVIFDNTDDTHDNTSDNTNDTIQSKANTYAQFWGLPAIKFDKWRPNIHIKASTDNGNLKNRYWDVTNDVKPDPESLFEYSQILYYDSNFTNFDPYSDATVDNFVLMPLAFEQKIFKRSLVEANKYDVSYDLSKRAVVITLNTINSNYLVLKPGTRVAVFATQRPKQWDSTNDYTIIDAIPGNNSLEKSSNHQTIKDNTSDRSETRTLGYLTYKGGTDIYQDASWDGDWFEGITIEPEKITIFMPYMKNGNEAKKYWDKIDTESVAPFMLFWVAIQQ